MKRLWKIFFALFLLSAGTTGTGLAEVIDEMAGPGLGSAPITDRAMDQSQRINLDRVQKTFDDSEPQDNTRHFNFDPDASYKVRLREFMVTTVVLPENEVVKGFSAGDPNVFLVFPLVKEDPDMGNVLHFKAKYPGADTNIIVYGKSGFLYSFYVRCDTVDSGFDPDLLVKIDDPFGFVRPVVDPVLDGLEKPSEEQASAKNEEADCKECSRRITPEKQNEPLSGEYLESLPLVDPSTLNFNYAIGAGDLNLAPARIFDDGYWTYFDFVDLRKMRHLPVIKEVVNGFDTPVNTRVKGSTLIAETVSPVGKWSLWNGNSYLCVRRPNE